MLIDDVLSGAVCESRPIILLRTTYRHVLDESFQLGQPKHQTRTCAGVTGKHCLHCVRIMPVPCPQLPIVKAACCNLIEQSLCEETVPSSLEIADR